MQNINLISKINCIKNLLEVDMYCRIIELGLSSRVLKYSMYYEAINGPLGKKKKSLGGGVCIPRRNSEFSRLKSYIYENKT